MAHIALGVTGGIGAYKAVEIARLLQRSGHQVSAVMTKHATRFVGPLTFEAVTGRRVAVDQFAPGTNTDIEHIALASGIDVLVVAPATANVLAKFAHGIADDFLTATYLATTAPVVVAPAMNSNMFAHPAVAQNLAVLAARGVHIVDPGEGYLACGWIGKGRLAEPPEVVAAVERVLTPEGPLDGARVVVSAGPTYEDIDPVRYIGNRSSGRMGLALAAEARRLGAHVTLVLGPTRLPPPACVDVIRVRSAAEMHAAMTKAAPGSDVVIMAAAVADYTPAAPAAEKVAKQPGGLSLELVRTRDILSDLGALRGDGSLPVLVGFAAETHEVVAKARAKLRAKRVDAIVANDVSRRDAGFDVESNAATLIDRHGDEVFPLQSKDRLAQALWRRITALLDTARATGVVAPS